MNTEIDFEGWRERQSKLYNEIYYPEALKLIGADQSSGTCMLHALATLDTAPDNVNALLVAGTASWRYRSDDDAGEDGNTHFSYIFDHVEAMLTLTLDRCLPEMHIWNMVGDTNGGCFLIDASLPLQHAQHLEIGDGNQWSPDYPLDHGFPVEMHRLTHGRYIYEPDQNATCIARHFAYQFRDVVSARQATTKLAKHCG